jgi:hypothetical protein
MASYFAGQCRAFNLRPRHMRFTHRPSDILLCIVQLHQSMILRNSTPRRLSLHRRRRPTTPPAPPRCSSSSRSRRQSSAHRTLPSVRRSSLHEEAPTLPFHESVGNAVGEPSFCCRIHCIGCLGPPPSHPELGVDDEVRSDSARSTRHKTPYL